MEIDTPVSVGILWSCEHVIEVVEIDTPPVNVGILWSCDPVIEVVEIDIPPVNVGILSLWNYRGTFSNW